MGLQMLLFIDLFYSIYLADNFKNFDYIGRIVSIIMYLFLLVTIIGYIYIDYFS